MEKPIYPLKTMRITQGYNIGTHINSFAIDDGGMDTNIENVYAPFTGYIKKIYTEDANEVWLESASPVEYPDGTIDYMTVIFAHCDDVSNLSVGQKISQGEAFYKEGTKGNAIGNHCHLECGKGKFASPGWYRNDNGYYVIFNGKAPEDCFWIDNTITIVSDNGYDFKMTSEETPEVTVSEEDQVIEDPNDDETPEEPTDEDPPATDISDQSPSNIKLIYTCKKDGLYGIYLKKGNEVYLK